VELKGKSRFVADGHARWSAAHADKARAASRKNDAGENEPVGFFGKIRLWLKTERTVLRGQKTGEKSSPKILW
jgi:hypothetical protein